MKGREVGSAELAQILRAWLLIVIGLLVIAGTIHACQDDAEAHTLQAWQCQYLAYERAENGKRYAWKLRCVDYRTKHAMYHRYGRLWPCYLIESPRRHARCIVRGVFASVGQAGKAERVAWCESRFDVRARNGQYLGMMQMGRRERARFGHGGSALVQAQAALRYWRVAGWRPWECA